VSNTLPNSKYISEECSQKDLKKRLEIEGIARKIWLL